jgi:hypothetical protein
MSCLPPAADGLRHKGTEFFCFPLCACVPLKLCACILRGDIKIEPSPNGAGLKLTIQRYETNDNSCFKQRELFA